MFGGLMIEPDGVTSYKRVFFKNVWTGVLAWLVVLFGAARHATAQRYVVADQDGSGPGGSNMAALLVLLQSPDVHLLGITVVTGDGWRDEEVAHTLRLLELVGRTDVGVYAGAAFPLVRTQAATRLAESLYGKNAYLGAWTTQAAWDAVPPLKEGAPKTKAADEDAAHFLVRMVHAHPHEVTIYAAGPLTNIALACRLDPHFAELARDLVVMGGSINPHTNNPEFVDNPRHEFNLWFDPEAAHIVLTAKWTKIDMTTVDASIQTALAPVLTAVKNSPSPAAQYLVKYAPTDDPSDFAWDELAAATWLDPAITTKALDLYMDVDLSHGPSYGNLLTWSDTDRPAVVGTRVHAQVGIDVARLNALLMRLFSAATPGAKDVVPLPAKR
jgi:purine nucleosidase